VNGSRERAKVTLCGQEAKSFTDITHFAWSGASLYFHVNQFDRMIPKKLSTKDLRGSDLTGSDRAVLGVKTQKGS
jgi:hypothetical protein